MWKYAQKTGELSHDDEPVARGYSGFESGKNNPDMQNVPNVGPIPQGGWTIEKPAYDSPDHGPHVMRLIPRPETETLTIVGFLMHGDSVQHAGSASHGCIIMPRPIREQVSSSPDNDLEVVSGE